RHSTSPAGLLGYWSSLFGPVAGRVWVCLGIPCFLANVILSYTGHEYRPDWFNVLGSQASNVSAGVILFSYIVAYMIGGAIGSSQNTFNKARLQYERVVATNGYWFDRRSLSGHYADSAVALKDSMGIYDSLLQELQNRGSNEVIQRQQIM